MSIKCDYDLMVREILYDAYIRKCKGGILAGSSEYDSTFLNQTQSMIEEADQNLQQLFLARTITTLYS